MSKSTILASGKIGRESIIVELTELEDDATVTITWPKNAISISPRSFPDIAAAIARLFANASTELARIKAGDRP
jgi:hypothetical protein